MTEGIIVKALSGFYYVSAPQGIVTCKARGRFRLDGTSPLVGDRVTLAAEADGTGRIESVMERKNFFIRPAVANVDALIFVAANANPVTDPFLIDRVGVIAAEAGCELIVCLNKIDLDEANRLTAVYTAAGYRVIRTSAATGEGTEELRAAIDGKISALTGNSGVGKSSLLNLLLPGADIPVDEVSERLGRGKHTTRHVEMYALGNDTFVADTPGFASFDIMMIREVEKEALAHDFPDFVPFLSGCRFDDCTHRKEPGCALRAAVDASSVAPSRYASYLRLYELISSRKAW